MDNDYYSAMYTWFEKCGIISNVRTHLRQNLVNALKRKDLGLCRTREARSAKQYVYDMLVAEYLFSHNYSFTLSIFASEVPLLVNFCNSMPQYSSNDNDKDSSSRHTKLPSDYITHTLETLGIDPNRHEGQHIISSYMNNETPLLLSILSSIASLVDSVRSSAKDSSSHNKETQADLMLEANVANAKKIQTVRKKIIEQKQLYDSELRAKEHELQQQASVIKCQLDTLTAKMEEAQSLMQMLSLKEKQLSDKKESDTQYALQKEMELSMRQNFLTQEANRLKRERDTCRKFENDLKKLQRELVKMQKEMPQSGSNQCAQTGNVKNIHVQTELGGESRAVMDECRTLQREKLELTNLVREQRSRIEQITQHSAQLSRQLEEAHLLRSVHVEVPVPVARISANTIFSESSSTEDILQDAKMRLKRLEEESSKADQYFCSFVNTAS